MKVAPVDPSHQAYQLACSLYGEAQGIKLPEVPKNCAEHLKACEEFFALIAKGNQRVRQIMAGKAGYGDLEALRELAVQFRRGALVFSSHMANVGKPTQQPTEHTPNIEGIRQAVAKLDLRQMMVAMHIFKIAYSSTQFRIKEVTASAQKDGYAVSNAYVEHLNRQFQASHAIVRSSEGVNFQLSPILRERYPTAEEFLANFEIRLIDSPEEIKQACFATILKAMGNTWRYKDRIADTRNLFAAIAAAPDHKVAQKDWPCSYVEFAPKTLFVASGILATKDAGYYTLTDIGREFVQYFTLKVGR